MIDATRRTLLTLFPLLLGGPAAAVAGGTHRTLGDAERAELLALREGVWRAWFGGDADRLREALPEEFLGLSWGPGPWRGRDETIADALAFKAGGGRLHALEFPRTDIQAWGDVVVLYTTYRIEFDSAGERLRREGRGTEMFVRRGGRWLHPGWHLDLVV